MPRFKIAAAQVPSIRGDIDRNIATHAVAIEAAARQHVSVLVFPELSLTGYEPELAADLAIHANDLRLKRLFDLARRYELAVVAGAPLVTNAAKPALGAILFTAEGAAKTYCKMHLGGSEPACFTPGAAPLSFSIKGQTTGLAICADASQPSHPQSYAAAGAEIYAAGVFLNEEWYATDAPRLGGYAARYRMLVVMANHAASVGTHVSVGKSAVWSPQGALLAQAEGAENALVIATLSEGTWLADVVRV